VSAGSRQTRRRRRARRKQARLRISASIIKKTVLVSVLHGGGPVQKLLYSVALSLALLGVVVSIYRGEDALAILLCLSALLLYAVLWIGEAKA
jgi:hypothetical protein